MSPSAAQHAAHPTHGASWWVQGMAGCLQAAAQLLDGAWQPHQVPQCGVPGVRPRVACKHVNAGVAILCHGISPCCLPLLPLLLPLLLLHATAGMSPTFSRAGRGSAKDHACHVTAADAGHIWQPSIAKVAGGQVGQSSSGRHSAPHAKRMMHTASCIQGKGSAQPPKCPAVKLVVVTCPSQHVMAD